MPASRCASTAKSPTPRWTSSTARRCSSTACWTPCAGPALAAILFVASGLGEVWRGGLLLLVYGLAMTLPFVVAAFFAQPFLRWLGRHRSIVAWVEKGMGVMLIVFAVLIATDSVSRIAQVLLDSFDWSATTL